MTELKTNRGRPIVYTDPEVKRLEKNKRERIRYEKIKQLKLSGCDLSKMKKERGRPRLPVEVLKQHQKENIEKQQKRKHDLIMECRGYNYALKGIRFLYK